MNRETFNYQPTKEHRLDSISVPVEFNCKKKTVKKEHELLECLKKSLTHQQIEEDIADRRRRWIQKFHKNIHLVNEDLEISHAGRNSLENLDLTESDFDKLFSSQFSILDLLNVTEKEVEEMEKMDLVDVNRLCEPAPSPTTGTSPPFNRATHLHRVAKTHGRTMLLRQLQKVMMTTRVRSVLHPSYLNWERQSRVEASLCGDLGAQCRIYSPLGFPACIFPRVISLGPQKPARNAAKSTVQRPASRRVGNTVGPLGLPLRLRQDAASVPPPTRGQLSSNANRVRLAGKLSPTSGTI